VTLVDLSHTLTDGMVTYPGLPGPVITDFWTREESRAHYTPPTEFHIGRIDMVANTGTYLDTPSHRWEGREDLAAIPLEAVAELPGSVIRASGPALGPDLLTGRDLTGSAVLFDTGWSRHWGTDAYAPPGHPHVTEALAAALVAIGAILVGIDSVNIDDTEGGTRPAHSILLDAGIPVVEHLTGLDQIPDEGFHFSAVPAKVAGLGTFPVRAYASF
jgi:kynurenine formamidase